MNKEEGIKTLLLTKYQLNAFRQNGRFVIKSGQNGNPRNSSIETIAVGDNFLIRNGKKVEEVKVVGSQDTGIDNQWYFIIESSILR